MPTAQDLVASLGEPVGEGAWDEAVEGLADRDEPLALWDPPDQPRSSALSLRHEDTAMPQPFRVLGFMATGRVLDQSGAGVPGVGGWLSVWAYGPSIIPLSASVWIAVSTALVY